MSDAPAITPPANDADQVPTLKLPEWPPEFRCPFVPWRREGGHLMFQERVPQPGAGPRRVWLSQFQVTRGLIDDLGIHPAFLAEHFPPTPAEIEGGREHVRTCGDYAWSIWDVAYWLRQSIAEATDQREARFTSRRDRRPTAPAPIQPADNYAMARPSAATSSQRITTFFVQRHDDGRRRVSVTCTQPGIGGNEERAFSGFLTEAEATSIAEVLLGRRVTS